MKYVLTVWLMCCILLTGCGISQKIGEITGRPEVSVAKEEPAVSAEIEEIEVKPEAQPEKEEEPEAPAEIEEIEEESGTQPEKEEEEEPEPLEVKYSYNGTSFTVNGKKFNTVTDFEVASTAVMNMTEAGDWIVVEGHINPHVGAYYLYNKYTEKVEKIITGANLTWKNDDLTTAVYSSFNEVFNFKDHVIGNTESEVYELSFGPGEGEVTAEDSEGNLTTFETGPGDAAMYRYADYLRCKSAFRWKAFLKEASKDALAYVMINPPEDVENLLVPRDARKNASGDTVYVAALQDDTKISLASGEYDLDYIHFIPGKTIEEFRKNQGEWALCSVVVPEGIPNTCISIAAKDEKGQFPIFMISGEYDICGTFITAEED